jgi:hypothetical protein
MQKLPDTVDRGDGPIANGKDAAHEDEAAGSAHDLAPRLDQIADLNGGNEMGIELDRRAKPALDRIQHHLTEGLIGEGHQHAAVHDPSVVDMARIGPEREYPAAILEPFQDRTNEMREIIGNTRLPVRIGGHRSAHGRENECPTFTAPIAARDNSLSLYFFNYAAAPEWP